MNKGFVSIITLLIIVGVISVGAAGTIFILKSGSNDAPSEEKIEIELTANEIPKVAPSSPAIQQPAAKPETETQTSKPPVPTPIDTVLFNLEREITVLVDNKIPIGQEHYERLLKSTDDAEKAGSDKESIARLRGMLETILSYAVETTPPAPAQVGSSSPQEEKVSCANDLRPQLTADITDFSKIRKITAPGTASIEGPKGHSFIWTGGARVPVYAPAAITLESGSYSKDTAESPAQYLLFFIVKENCNYRVKFDHIDEPVASIREQFSATPAVADSSTKEAPVKLTFSSGDLIGYTSGTVSAGNWDFGMYNLKEEGILKTQYNSYGIHGYAVCWTDFYSPDIKKQHYRNLLEGPTLVCFF